MACVPFRMNVHRDRDPCKTEPRCANRAAIATLPREEAIAGSAGHVSGGRTERTAHSAAAMAAPEARTRAESGRCTDRVPSRGCPALSGTCLRARVSWDWQAAIRRGRRRADVKEGSVSTRPRAGRALGCRRRVSTAKSGCRRAPRSRIIARAELQTAESGREDRLVGSAAVLIIRPRGCSTCRGRRQEATASARPTAAAKPMRRGPVEAVGGYDRAGEAATQGRAAPVVAARAWPSRRRRAGAARLRPFVCPQAVAATVVGTPASGRSSDVPRRGYTDGGQGRRHGPVVRAERTARRAWPRPPSIGLVVGSTAAGARATQARSRRAVRTSQFGGG